MRYLIIYILIFIIMCIESPLLAKINLMLFPPDIPLIGVIYFATTASNVKEIVFALILGLLKDAFSLGTPFGMFVEIYVIIFIMTFLISKKFNFNSMSTLLLFSFIFDISSNLLFFLFLFLFDKNFSQYGIIFKMILPHAFLTMLFTPIFFHFFIWIDNKLKSRLSKEIILRP